MNIRYAHPEAISRLFDLRKDECPIAWRTFGVGVAIASFMNQSGECFPSRAAVAERTGLDQRAVSRALHELEERGFIRIKSRPGTSNCICLPLVKSTQGQINTLGQNDPPPLGRIDPPPLVKSTQGQIDTLGQNDLPSLGQIDPPPLGQFDPPKEPIKKPMKELLGAGNGSASSTAAIPFELKGMELYEADQNLCASWEKLKTSWTRAYPNVDYLAEVAKAHTWEIANPKKRKSDRPRFLTNWLNRAAKNPQHNQATEDEKRAEELFQRASLAYSHSGIEESLSASHAEGEEV